MSKAQGKQVTERREQAVETAAASATAADDPLLTSHRAMQIVVNGRALAWRWAAEGKVESSTDGLRRVRLSALVRAIEEVARR